MAPLINFTGLATGIDSKSLIEAILDQQRKARITPLKASITELQDTNSAFSKLSELLGTLHTAASRFRTINGGVLAKNGSSTDESVVTATASNSATNGTYTVTVSSLAKNATYSFDDRFSSDNAIINSSINNGAPAANRTVVVRVGTGANQESVNVVLDNTTTLSEFVTEYNSEATKSTASVVNVGTSGSPSYALVFTTNNSGTEQGGISVQIGSEIQTAGTGAFVTSTVDAADDAEFTVSGISGTITRSTNSVTDVIPGLTLNLAGTGTATITIGDDAATTTSSVQDFVDAYNAVVEYIKENDLITREEDGEDVTNIFGPLASTSIDENVLSALRSALSEAGISGATVNVLADLGITTERDGTLKFDTDVFEEALADDPASVGTIFENLGETLASVGGTIDQYTRFNGVLDIAINANESRISEYNRRISDTENSLARQEEVLIAQFARLEALVGSLSTQQATLASLVTK